MSDDVVATPEDSAEAVASAETSADVVATAEAYADVVATVETYSDAVATVEAYSDAVAIAESAQEAVVTAEENDDVVAESDVASLTGLDREKLDSIEMGANRCRCGLIPLSYASEKGNSGSGEPGDMNGDSTKWIGSSSFKEIAHTHVQAPKWKKNGVLHFGLTAEFWNSTGAGTETGIFELRWRPGRPTDPGTSTSTFGLPQAWTTLATLTSKAIAVGAGQGRMTVEVDISAEGHVGTAYGQTLDGRIKAKNLAGGAPDIAEIDPTALALDPTINLDFQWRFRFSVVPSDTCKLNVRSYAAWLVNPNPMGQI